MAYCFSYQRFLNEKLKVINEKFVDQIDLWVMIISPSLTHIKISSRLNQKITLIFNSYLKVGLDFFASQEGND
jgi:hypothetical protein